MKCAISGNPFTPSSDIVVTPSGYLCERRLLLSQLSSNNSTDPFSPDKTVDENELTTLHNPLSYDSVTLMPPRPATASSFPSLLEMMQKEVDGILLELFDTRKALEETRRELSQALYQNDAAVRVIARLSMERDAAREKLSDVSPVQQTAEPSKKRKMDVEEERVESVVVERDPSLIPAEDISNMVSTWKTLSKGRRKRTPPPSSYATPSTLSTLTQVDKKSLHKSTGKSGITCLASVENLILTASKDKTVIVYDRSTSSVTATLTGSTGDIIAVDICANPGDDSYLIVTASIDGMARVYTLPGPGTPQSVIPIGGGSPVGISIQPTLKYFLVSTKEGRISFCSLEDTLAVFQEEEEEGGQKLSYTCGGLHPDGLIYAAGTEDGKLVVWDLKTGVKASTLQEEGQTSPITSLDFSENGYHFASSSSSGQVNVWDLRKLKSIATINDTKAVFNVSFDHAGKFMAYSTEEEVSIVVVKDWNNVIKTLTFQGDNRGASFFSWGGDARWAVTACETERMVRFWGEEQKKDEEDKEQKKEEDKEEEQGMEVDVKDEKE